MYLNKQYFIKKMDEPFSLDGLFDFSDLSPSSQRHLRRVYSYLSSGIVVAILCFVLAQYFPSLSGVFAILGIISLIADIVLIYGNRNTKNGRRVSCASLYGYASLIGGGLGIYLSRMDTESRIKNYRYCMSALVSSLVIFLLFSIFSILTSNRASVYVLVTIFSIILGLGSMLFFGYSVIISIILGVFYVISDTQYIIYRAKSSQTDAITDAKMLFIDLLEIFYHIYENLQNKDEDKDE